jgi:hypothetical protein
MFVILIFKSTNFLANQNEIKSFYKSVEGLIESALWIKGEKLKRRIKQIDRIFKIFFFSTLVSVLMSSVVVFTEHELPVKMWFPYDFTSNEALFWMSAIYQIVGPFIVASIAITLFTFPSFILSCLTGIVEELNKRLENIGKIKTLGGEMTLKVVENLETIENYEELVVCVKFHQKILEMTGDFNRIFGNDFWFHGLISIISLCTTSFSLIVVSSICFRMSLEMSTLKTQLDVVTFSFESLPRSPNPPFSGGLFSL